MVLAYGCPPNGSATSAWPTKDEEYIKFGSRLVNQRSGVTRNMILDKYKRAWKALHPTVEVPLTPNGEPIDFLWEEIYPCNHIPWMKDIPASDPLTGKKNDHIFQYYIWSSFFL